APRTMRARISRGSRRLAMQSSRASDGSMRRVMVVGCAGAGKTTLARSLAARLRLPLIHLDFHFWRAGWQLPRYGRTRPDLPASSPERFDFPFLRYVWNFPEKHRPRIVNAIERFGGHLRIARLRNDRDAHEFLAMLGRG